MTRRRNTINIYDYPEHLNPFREDADDNCDKFNTTGRRRSSFRVNAWTMFSPNKGKSKTSEDINPSSPSTTSRFMTWTPKLLRRSFRRSSPSRSTREPVSPSSSHLSYRTPSSRTNLPPSGSSRTSLQSNSSRSRPPSSSPPSRPTSPPSRPPAPTNFRSSLSPSRSISPHSTENVNTETVPVPPRRRALFPANSPERTAGEQPSADDVKYIQQGAKPKKKRKAPLPPQPSPIKPFDNGDVRQASTNQESDVSLAPMTSNDAEDTTSTETPNPTIPEDAEVAIPSSETHPDEGPPEEKPPENEEEKPSENEEKENGPENERSPPTHKEEKQIPQIYVSEEAKISEVINAESELHENNTINGITEINEIGCQLDENHDTKLEDETKQTQNNVLNGIAVRQSSDEDLKVDFNVVLHISEEDLKDKDDTAVGHNHSKSDENHNFEHIKTNTSVKMKDSTEGSAEHQENTINGEHSSHEDDVLQNEEEMNNENAKQNSKQVPAPKPRTILPNSLKE